MKMAEYEKSRAQLLHEETNKNLKDCQLENDKMLKKLEVSSSLAAYLHSHLHLFLLLHLHRQHC